MQVGIIGSGYVGTTTALCLAELGHDVINVDVDEEVVRTLNRGETHIHEPGLQDLLDKHVEENFQATTDYSQLLKTKVTFLCLPTPSREDGSINLSITESAAKRLGKKLREKDSRHIVVMKSTVVPGSTEEIGGIISKESDKDLDEDLFVVSNPEFLREGTAVQDFMNPDKIVLGGKEEAQELLKEVYGSLLLEAALVETDVRTAEMIKYANNALLATKISFANEIGNVCKEFDIDVYDVMDAVGLDDRIERRFLDAGAGFGGSCFPKDVRAIAAKMRGEGVEPRLLDAALEVNEEQPIRAVEILEDKVGDISSKTVAVLGLAFKSGTDDVRESRSIPAIEELLKKGASVIAHDPEAVENMEKIFPGINYAAAPSEAMEESDACLLMTAWPEYGDLDIDIPCVEGRRMNKCDGVCW